MEGYLGLFLTAFLAATLLPISSELLLTGLLTTDAIPFWLWFWATLGNTLGAVLNWALGRYCLRFQDRPWFPFPPKSLRTARIGFQRYGVGSLLFAWTPVVGDGLTFIAGVLGIRFPVFLILTLIGKGGRYAVLVGLVQEFT